MRHLDEARDLQGEIKRVLLREWDPIGVEGIDEASDEYDAYVAHLYKLLIRRASRQEIADYLWWAVTEHMGLCGDRQLTERVAAVLSALVGSGDDTVQQTPKKPDGLS
jgi:hypothetical protein